MDNNQNKYLTEMKELPPENQETVTTGKKTVDTEEMIMKNVKSVNTTKPVKPLMVEEKKPSINSENNSYLAEENEKSFTTKDIVLGIVNFLCMAGIIYLIVKFPVLAQEYKSERTQYVLNESGVNYEFLEVGKSKTKADEIGSYFADDSDIAEFLNELGVIQTETGLIQKISFGNQKEVLDKASGLMGVPVIIEFSGDLDQILLDLEKIQKLPYIMRAISIDSNINVENPELVNFKYGAFLYVDESLK